jgi:hypothetical protein
VLFAEPSHGAQGHPGCYRLDTRIIAPCLRFDLREQPSRFLRARPLDEEKGRAGCDRESDQAASDHESDAR